MATKTLDYSSLTQSPSYNPGGSTAYFFLGKGTTNTHTATVTYPKLGVPSGYHIDKVTLNVEWEARVNGAGFLNADNTIQFKIGSTVRGSLKCNSGTASGNATVAISGGYSNTADWTVSISSLNPPSSGNAKCIKKSTLDAKVTYSANTYTVKFNGNGNNGGSTAEQSHTYGSSNALTSNGFTKTGYTFQGWATSSTGSVKYANKESVTNLTTTNGGTVNLYAVWKANTYTIAFNGNTNTGGSMTSLSMTYDVAKALTANSFSKTGHSFAGWSETAGGAKAYDDKASVKNLVTSGTKTLYARWTANTYTVKVEYYKQNVSDNNYTLVSSDTLSVSKTYGTSYTPPRNTYEGFNTPASQTITVSTASVVKYNYSRKTYTQNVTHQKQDPNNTSAWTTFQTTSATVKYGATYTPAFVTPPTGYKTDTIDKAYTVTGEKTTIAKYVPIEYVQKVEYRKYNYGTSQWSIFDEKNTTKKYGTTFTPETVAAPIGYKRTTNITSYVVSGAKTTQIDYYPISYSFSYSSNGGSGVMSETLFYYDTAKALPENQFTRPGYEFLGWSLNKLDTEPDFVNEQEILNYTVDDGSTYALYAIWKPLAPCRYGVDGEWKMCEAFYGIDGEWVKVEMYYGADGKWTQTGVS